MKNVTAIGIIVCIVTAMHAQIGQKPVTVSAHVDDGNRVYMTLGNIKKEMIDTVTIYRSFLDINKMYALDLDYYPITKTQIAGKAFTGIIIDSLTAHNTVYTYYVKIRYTDGETVPSKVISVSIPDIVMINTMQDLSLYIDKVNYFCEVRYGNLAGKRFPVNLGNKPGNRKTYYDCMSTPEGIYYVEYIRPVTAYYKALGVSYPNNADRKRYQQALRRKSVPMKDGKTVSIGGSIQIHGGGIGNNWTWGCIAMRNGDLDQIFALPQLRKGVPITITGKEFSYDSLLLKDAM
jgi:hypothetical protein